jgi:cytochrome c peroxidase
MFLSDASRPSVHALLGALFVVTSVLAGDTVNPELGLPAIVVPADNPITLEKIALGKKLFFDRRLSKNGTLSCAMCHIPEQGFTQNELATSVGFEGKSLRRNAPSLLNVALHDSFQRDGAKASLETQVWGPLLAADEMANGTVANLVERINSFADYQGTFERAFAGKSADEFTIGQALATFERTLLAGNSRFDRWYFGGDQSALSAQEQAGFRVFIASGCTSCHRVDERAAPFTDNRFHNTGASAYARQRNVEPVSVQLAPGVTIQINRGALANVSESAREDFGHFEVTGDPRDRDAFKTPTLRNVALTAPYMHDGSLSSLDAVIEFYAGAPRAENFRRPNPLIWTAGQKSELQAFLLALTGELPIFRRD